jgi:Spy/CpxP family protein refolding chaperone
MTRSTLVAFTAAALTIALTSSASAQTPMPPPPPGGPDVAGHYAMLFHALSLTSTQEEQVHAILEAHRVAAAPLIDSLRAAHDALDSRLFAANGDLSISALADDRDRLVRAQAQLDAEGWQTTLKLRSLLTPDQRAHLADLHAKLESLRQQTDELLRPTLPSSPR